MKHGSCEAKKPRANLALLIMYDTRYSSVQDFNLVRSKQL